MPFNYIPTATGRDLHNCGKPLKLLVGPFGSGKSCMCAMDVLISACAQAPAPDGIRYSRVGVIRSSYPELQKTTRKSLLEVLPPECGTINISGSPISGFYTIPLPDGTTVQLELELWAIQTADDCSKLRSCNWTFCWINEATGCAPEVYNMVTSRIGRFPPRQQGGVSNAYTLMDMNYPATGTWLNDFIKHPEKDWQVFMQPPAAFKREDAKGMTYYEINPCAENLYNLGASRPDDPPDFPPEERGKRYYREQIETNLRTGREDVVQNLYCLMDVPIIDGKPVYPNFDKRRHVAANPLVPIPFKNIIIGVDQSGIHPAAVILQNQNGFWCVLDELYMDNEGFEQFLYGGLVPLLREKYSTCPVIAAIDPSNTRDSWQAITPKERFEAVGITAVTEIDNSPKIRIQCVEHMLNLYTGGLLISPTCELLIRGFESEYRYRRLRAAGSIDAAYTPQPEKGPASHLQDANQYACLLISKGLHIPDSYHNSVVDRIMEHRQKLIRIV